MRPTQSESLYTVELGIMTVQYVLSKQVSTPERYSTVRVKRRSSYPGLKKLEETRYFV